MDNFYSELPESLKTGFIDRRHPSRKEYLPQLLINDKTNQKKVLSTILRDLRDCEEFWFSVAFVTRDGVASIINYLQELSKRGVKGKILVSQYQNFTQPEALKALRQFKNIDLRIVVSGNFHAKGYIFHKEDRFDLIIGSSNLTASALSANKEWNLKVTILKEGELLVRVLEEFNTEFNSAMIVDDKFIQEYEKIYYSQLKYIDENQAKVEVLQDKNIIPNKMQSVALENLRNMREKGIRKALLISATGTGKTYLSAFDVKQMNPDRMLFVVHRENITRKSMKSFERIFGSTKKFGLYTGGISNTEADYVFSTIQTISRDEHLEKFKKDHFNYIVIDETHRAGADSYQKILNYFDADFVLGMTATPERTDGFDIFKQFDYNIAYEIRLQKALEEGMLCDFHYYGVADITVENQILEDNSDFNKLVATERIDRIIDAIKMYSCDDGEIRGLVFCSRIEEANRFAEEFRFRGYKAKALSGENSEMERVEAIERLESDDEALKIDYIFTVDIFNEGVDIPRINQIVMLRPTQSAIIFVQQLGRGLRKTRGKNYLTVIDFIGNYQNNFLVPIALFGDTSYNKDTIRKLLNNGSDLIPGSSTVNFDKISKDRIYKAIDNANIQRRKDLVQDYRLLKYKIGRVPMMCDFLQYGSRDPMQFVQLSNSYFQFLVESDDEFAERLPERFLLLLKLFSLEIANGKRVIESLMIQDLIENEFFEFKQINKIVKEKLGFELTKDTFFSCISSINFNFVTENHNKKMIPVSEKYNLKILTAEDYHIKIGPDLKAALKDDVFRRFFKDLIRYSIQSYMVGYNLKLMIGGFILYRKYSRKDVFRILNWDQNPVAQNVGGYIVSQDKSNCPIFVNYHKAEDISSSINFEDGFISPFEFKWMTKSNRKISSGDVQSIMNYRSGLRIPLFIKKSNDEGLEFYYMGDIIPIDDSFEEAKIKDDNGKWLPVVKIRFKMLIPVEQKLYEYLIEK